MLYRAPWQFLTVKDAGGQHVNATLFIQGADANYFCFILN